jgi:hypothetical protein
MGQFGIALFLLDLIIPQTEGNQCLDRLPKIDSHVKSFNSRGHCFGANDRERLGAFEKVLSIAPMT